MYNSTKNTVDVFLVYKTNNQVTALFLLTLKATTSTTYGWALYSNGKIASGTFNAEDVTALVFRPDIENNEFGVDYGSFDFMTDTIQSQRNVSVPMGAGAYMATNNKNEDDVTGTEFFSSNVVYFKANPHFEGSMEASLPEGSEVDYKVNTEKVRYQIVPTNDALNMLQSGTVHYVTPQLTKENASILNSIK